MANVYTYARHAFLPDGTRHTERCEIDGAALATQAGGCLHGRAALLHMVNRWNRSGLLGVPNGRPIYVYVAEESE